VDKLRRTAFASTECTFMPTYPWRQKTRIDLLAVQLASGYATSTRHRYVKDLALIVSNANNVNRLKLHTFLCFTSRSSRRRPTRFVTR
jgi:hypothetical protein